MAKIHLGFSPKEFWALTFREFWALYNVVFGKDKIKAPMSKKDVEDLNKKWANYGNFRAISR